jgi:hypothetical protein
MLQARMRELAESDLENKKQLLQPAEDLVASIGEEAIADLFDYTKDTDQLLGYRDLVASEIVRLSDALGDASGR